MPDNPISEGLISTENCPYCPGESGDDCRNVGHWKMAADYWRGVWRNSEGESAGIPDRLTDEVIEQIESAETLDAARAAADVLVAYGGEHVLAAARKRVAKLCWPGDETGLTYDGGISDALAAIGEANNVR